MKRRYTAIGKIDFVKQGKHANKWRTQFSRNNKNIDEFHETEQAAKDYIEALRDAYAKGDEDFIRQLVKDALERRKAEKEKRKTPEVEANSNKEKITLPASRRQLKEFTHTLILPMRTPREKCDYLIRILKQADQSQIICNERPITIPPHRIIYLGLRIPREGGAYVFQTALRILGWDSTFKIKKITTTKPNRKKN